MKDAFFTEKRLKISNKQNALKVNKKGHKKFLYFTHTYFCKNLFLQKYKKIFCLISLLFGYQWNTSISSSLATFLKVGIRKKSFRKICGICVIESPLKMMKNVFYFIVKALFVLKIFKFFSRHFGHIGKKPDLIRKIRSFSKFMTSQPYLQAIAIYIIAQYLTK